jgi:hypothetical protein
MGRTVRGPLRGVRRVDDAGASWRATLTCGHTVHRAKGRGRLTVFSSWSIHARNRSRSVPGTSTVRRQTIITAPLPFEEPGPQPYRPCIDRARPATLRTPSILRPPLKSHRRLAHAGRPLYIGREGSGTGSASRLRFPISGVAVGPTADDLTSVSPILRCSREASYPCIRSRHPDQHSRTRSRRADNLARPDPPRCQLV